MDWDMLVKWFEGIENANLPRNADAHRRSDRIVGAIMAVKRPSFNIAQEYDAAKRKEPKSRANPEYGHCVVVIDHP